MTGVYLFHFPNILLSEFSHTINRQIHLLVTTWVGVVGVITLGACSYSAKGEVYIYTLYEMQGRRTIVRMISICTTLLVVTLYAGLMNGGVDHSIHEKRSDLVPDDISLTTYISRHLLEEEVTNKTKSCKNGQSSDDSDNANCINPLDHGNKTCDFVYNYCSDDAVLANYLAFVACDLPHVKVCS